MQIKMSAVLLQTAQVEAVSENTAVPVWLLLDNESHHGPVAMSIYLVGWCMDQLAHPILTSPSIHLLWLVGNAYQGVHQMITCSKCWNNFGMSLLEFLISLTESSKPSFSQKFNSMEQGMKSGYHGRKIIPVVLLSPML